jgi:hypothetical protein
VRSTTISSLHTLTQNSFSTGRRRYGHPALTGVLPTPWLPLRKGQTLANFIEGPDAEAGSGDKNDAVVLTLRKRRTSRPPRRDARQASRGHTPGPTSALEGVADSNGTPIAENGSNPWRDDSSSGSNLRNNRLSYDHATGIIMLPDDSDWMGEDESSSDEAPGALHIQTDSGPSDLGNEEGALTPAQTMRSPTSQKRHAIYFHHPERRKSRMPGGFPRS